MFSSYINVKEKPLIKYTRVLHCSTRTTHCHSRDLAKARTTTGIILGFVHRMLFSTKGDKS